jgi:hypothetical protein
MPDLDWDAAEGKAKREARERYEEENLSDPAAEVLDTGFCDGWEAAMSWVKRQALLKMLGGGEASG